MQQKAVDGFPRIWTILQMEQFEPLSDFIAATLGLELSPARSHLSGLVSSGRLGTQPNAASAAEILSAALCTDPRVATALFDAPFAGAVLDTGNNSETIGPDHPAYSALCDSFGATLAALTIAAERGERAPGSVRWLCSNGAGAHMRAFIAMDSPQSLPSGILTCWYGYALLPELLAMIPKERTTLQTCRYVHGEVVDVLAARIGKQRSEAA